AQSSPAASTLSLHDALPILAGQPAVIGLRRGRAMQIPMVGRVGLDLLRQRAGGLDALAFQCGKEQFLGILRFQLRGGRCREELLDRKSTRLNSSHVKISYAV